MMVIIMLRVQLVLLYCTTCTYLAGVSEVSKCDGYNYVTSTVGTSLLYYMHVPCWSFRGV